MATIYWALILSPELCWMHESHLSHKCSWWACHIGICFHLKRLHMRREQAIPKYQWLEMTKVYFLLIPYVHLKFGRGLSSMSFSPKDVGWWSPTIWKVAGCQSWEKGRQRRVRRLLHVSTLKWPTSLPPLSKTIHIVKCNLMGPGNSILSSDERVEILMNLTNI